MKKLFLLIALSAMAAGAYAYKVTPADNGKGPKATKKAVIPGAPQQADGAPGAAGGAGGASSSAAAKNGAQAGAGAGGSHGGEAAKTSSGVNGAADGNAVTNTPPQNDFNKKAKEAEDMIKNAQKKASAKK